MFNLYSWDYRPVALALILLTNFSTCPASLEQALTPLQPVEPACMPLCELSEPQRIAIIGAGISGLRLGDLLQHTFDVTLYEARSERVGGRIFSVKMPHGVAELGAFNIRDGGKAENFISLIKELGLEFEDDQSIKYFDGVELVDCQSLIKPYEFTPAILKEKLLTIRKSSASMADVLRQLFPDNETLQQIFAIKIAAYEGSAVDKLSASCIDSLYYMLLEALSVTHASFSDEDGYACRLRIKGGNSVLTEKLAERLKGKIQLGKVLTSLTRDEDGVYHLSFADGSSTEADIVVLTVPCPVYASIVFGDNLIAVDRLKTIQGILYGVNSKILYPVKHPQVTGAYTNGRMIASYNSRNSVITSYYINDNGNFDKDSIAAIAEKDLPFLKQIYRFPDQYQEPIVAEDRAFSSYSGPVGHSWVNDPYARGSYSCLGVGQDETFNALEYYEGEQVKKLFAPVDKTLFFGGEAATILLDFNGTLEAAVETAERLARIITKVHLPSIMASPADQQEDK